MTDCARKLAAALKRIAELEVKAAKWDALLMLAATHFPGEGTELIRAAEDRVRAREHSTR